MFKPAILFLADENGDILTVHESRSLPKEMFTYYQCIEDKLKNGVRICDEEDEQFLMVTEQIEIDMWDTHWEGFIGIITDKSAHHRSELHAFLIGFKQSITFAAKLIEEEKKSKHFSEVKTVHDRVAKLLKDTNYTNDLQRFAAHFLNSIQGNTPDSSEIIFLIKDQARQIFMPVESTNKELMNIKEKYTIYLANFEDTFASITNKGFSQLSKIDVKGTLFDHQIHYHDFVLFPIIYQSEYVGMIMFLSKEKECKFVALQEISELLNAISPWIKRMMIDENMVVEKTRKELLLKVTQKFHSSMDVNAILEEVLEALYEAYPTFQVDLLLSLDWEVADHLPIHLLDYQGNANNDLAAKAYLTGELQAQDFLDERKTILYIPLKGKQGIYGVFRMKAANTLFFEEGELKFIQVLADTAGSAIENAELYQQSQQQIANLQLINQTSQQLNEKFKLSDVIQFMVNQVKKNFAIDELGFLLFDNQWTGKEVMVEGSSPYFSTEEARVELAPLIGKIKQKKEGIFLGNCDDKSIYQSSTYSSIMAVPMIHNQEVIGMVIGLGIKRYSFSFDTYKLFRSIVQHSTLVFVNSMLHEELEQLVITDYLTKLYTRKYLDEQVTQSLKVDQFGSFILIDIDEFKQVNDKYGHQTGDEVIIQVANIIKDQLKDKDALAARWGGEELAIYLREIGKEDAIQIAESIRRNVEECCDYGVTVSCGVSCWSSDTGNRSLNILFNHADSAMYKAKNQGKNQVVYQ